MIKRHIAVGAATHHELVTLLRHRKGDKLSINRCEQAPGRAWITAGLHPRFVVAAVDPSLVVEGALYRRLRCNLYHPGAIRTTTEPSHLASNRPDLELKPCTISARSLRLHSERRMHCVRTSEGEESTIHAQPQNRERKRADRRRRRDWVWDGPRLGVGGVTSSARSTPTAVGPCRKLRAWEVSRPKVGAICARPQRNHRGEFATTGWSRNGKRFVAWAW